MRDYNAPIIELLIFEKADVLTLSNDNDYSDINWNEGA